MVKLDVIETILDGRDDKSPVEQGLGTLAFTAAVDSKLDKPNPKSDQQDKKETQDQARSNNQQHVVDIVNDEEYDGSADALVMSIAFCTVICVVLFAMLYKVLVMLYPVLDDNYNVWRSPAAGLEASGMPLEVGNEADSSLLGTH